ncbi:putative Ig domain-containing protein, partial [Synechococcus sp. UW140]|uniref:putative Ig domain-containing protein n=1 Tax=Synechococcus sp. UW140 TaxID=368503 RepID=UPI003138260D
MPASQGKGASDLYAAKTGGTAAAPPPAGDPFDLVLLSAELAGSVPQAELAGARVVVLEAGRDGIGQIGAALAAHPGAAVVRVISHGEPGALLLAGQRISTATLAERADALAGWRQHLAPGAEILLYGCSVAASSEGRSFVDGLAALTVAAVAASVDITGAGGNLELAYTTGRIESGLAATQDDWDRAELTLALPNQRAGLGATFFTGSGNEFPNASAFAALNSQGEIKVWGKEFYGGSQSAAPTGSGYTAIYSNKGAFAALNSQGEIKVWGDPNNGGNQASAPTGSGYTAIYSNEVAFAALNSQGEIKVWGASSNGGNQASAPTGSGYTAIYSNQGAFAALNSQGEIKVWGYLNNGGNQASAPTGSGYTAIYSNFGAFAALNPQGEIKVWGASASGGNQASAPTGSGFTSIQTVLEFGLSIKISSDLASLGYGQTAQLSFELGAASSDFTASDLSVSNGSLGPLQQISGSEGRKYTAIFTPALNTKADAKISVAPGSFSSNSNANDKNQSASFLLAVDTKPAELANAQLVNNATALQLQFNRQLVDGQGAPAPSAFSVEADGTAINVSRVTISGNSATLTLAAAVADTVKQVSVRYSDPTGNNDAAALQDLSGQDTPSFVGLINQAPVFKSAASADFSTGVTGSFAAAATGSPTYSIAPATLFESSFSALPSDWALSNAQISGGSAALNPGSASTNGALILPKLGASSPGSFTAAFDYTAGNVTLAGTTASGTSFNYGTITGTTGSATGMVGGNGLVVSFLEAYTKAGAVTTTVPSSVEVRWNGTVIASAPVSFGGGAKPVQIKLDAANLLSVSYDNAQVLNANLSGKVNAADRANWQFALGSANTNANASSHSIDNLAIVTNGVLPAGLSLNTTTGEISGKPTSVTVASQQVFNLVATNGDRSTSQQFSLNLASGAPVFTSAATNPVLPGVPTTIAIAAAGSAGPTTYSVAPQTLVTSTLANAGTMPAGAYLNGSARFNAAALELTQNVVNQTSSVQFLGEGAQNLDAFRATFSYKVGGGTTVGGGNISFNYGPAGDNTKGLRVVITELVGTSNANLQVAVYAGDTLLSPAATIPNPFTAALYASSSPYLPISITMSAEGRVQVRVNNVLAFDAGNYTNWQTTDKSLWAFSFTGSTGASNNNFHTIKNLVIGTNGVLPPGLSLDPTTGVISGEVGIGTAVDEYVNVTATNAAGIKFQLLKLDVTASNTLPGQRPGTGTSLGGPNALGATGEQFRNLSAFAALTKDGSVSVWGNTANGGKQADAPTGTGYTVITSNEKAFAALKNDGSIVAWGLAANGGTGEPTGTGYQMISSTRDAFAAIKKDGSIVAWGNTANGGSFSATSAASPTGTGYIRIYANGGGFAAQKIDGTIKTWGNTNSIGTSALPATTAFAPRVTVNDYQSGTSSFGAFGAISTSGTISTWGSSLAGGTTGKPTTTGQQEVVTTSRAMAAIDSNGFITAWGDTGYGGTSAPKDSGYRQLYGNSAAFVAIRQDGSLSAWGSTLSGGSGAPTGTGYTQVYSTLNSFAALKADGSISVWGSSLEGGNTKVAPVASGYTNLFSSQGAFAAIKADGSVSVWGDTTMGGTGGPAGTGWSEITTSGTAFAARSSDGSLYAWGSSTTGGSGAPTTGNFLTVQSPTLAQPYFPQAAGAPVNLSVNQTQQSQVFLGIQGEGLTFTITNGKLPVGLTLDAATGWIYGNPAEPGSFPLTINATSAAGSVTQNFNLRVESSLLPNQRQGAGAVYTIGSGTEYANGQAFAGLTANGGVYSWGANDYGGSGEPTGTGYTQITASNNAYAALKYDGSIEAWGDSKFGGINEPTGSGYTKIYSAQYAFAALKADGSITAWGSTSVGGAGAPTGSGYTKIYSTKYGFAALKADGSITAWGSVVGAPTGSGYTSITPNAGAYAALKADGSITAWGDSVNGGSNAPTGTGYTRIFASNGSYAALKVDGSIAVWGHSNNGGGTNGPTGSGFVDIWSTANGFAAMKTDGSLVSWGATGTFGTSFPTGTGFRQVFSTGGSFAALKADGAIISWGATDSGGTGAPTGTGFTTIYTNNNAFAAMKADGSITVWGKSTTGGFFSPTSTNSPTGTGYTQIFSRADTFAAMKADGTVKVWGLSSGGLQGATAQVAFASLQNATAVVPARQFAVTGNLPAARLLTPLATQATNLNGVAAYQVGANTGLGLGSAITSGALPDGLSLNVATGYLEGTPTKQGTSNFTVSTYNGSGESSQDYSLTVLAASTTTAAPTFNPTKPIGYANYAVGQAASYDLSAVSTSANTVNYAHIAGALPTGMTLQTSGKVIGTPTTPGNYQFTLAASDSKGVAAQTFTIKVSDNTLPNQRTGQYSTIDTLSSGTQGLNERAFAALRPDGTITSWGDSTYGGFGASGVPTGAGYVQIAQTSRAFAALRYDGSIQAWGDSDYGGLGAPSGTGFTRLFSSGYAFAAMKADGSISTWGTDIAGGTGEPTGTGYSQIFSNGQAMVAMKSDGSLVAWGASGKGGSGAPTGTGYVTITSNASAFAALKADGSITAWGDSTFGGLLPTLASNNSYTAIYSNPNAFAALRADGTITTWGYTSIGDNPFTGGSNFISVSATGSAFAALKSDGTITAWGNSLNGAKAPPEAGYTALYSTQGAFAGLKTDGSIKAWGLSTAGVTGAPTTTGWTQIVSNQLAFTALRNDGTVKSWGNTNYGGGKSPTGATATGFTQVFSTSSAFVGQKSDGSLIAWGNTDAVNLKVPIGTGLTVSSARAAIPYQQSGTTGDLPTAYLGKPIGPDGGAGPAAYQVGAISQGTYYSLTGDLPAGLTLNPATGYLSGTPTTAGSKSFTITSTSAVGTTAQVYTLEVKQPLAVMLPNQRVGSGAVYSAGSGQATSNAYAFAALNADGSISAWGDSRYGGSSAPTGTGFTQIFSNQGAYAAIKADGSIQTWGNGNFGGSSAPSGTGFTQIFSTTNAFSALKADGSITAWGNGFGGTGAPTGTGFTQVSSNIFAFSALKADGSISSWGFDPAGGTGAPTGTGFLQVFSNAGAFAALKNDGSITTWGDSNNGGTGAPTTTGFTQVFSTGTAFAALKADGSISAWGNSDSGGTGAPAGTGYTQVFSNTNAFVARNANGSLTAWGNASDGGSFSPTSTNSPTGTGYTQVFSTGQAFAALKSDGSIKAWGNSANGGSNAPSGTGFTQVFSTGSAFAGLKADGSIFAWGNSNSGGTGAPTSTGFTQVFSTGSAFAGLKADGSISAWGNSANGGTNAPTGTGYATVQSALVSDPAFAAFPANSSLSTKTGQAFFANLGAQGVGARYEITVGALPAGLTLDATTGVLSGSPTGKGTFPFILSASTPAGTASQTFNLVVEGSSAPSFTSAAASTFTVGTAKPFTVVATGDPAPTYAVSGTTPLPSGLTLNATTGLISGTPVAGTGGVSNLIIIATNSAGSTNQDFKLTLNQAPAITSVASKTVQTGTSGSFNFTASGYPAPRFSTDGPLPTGVTLTSTGELSGTPAAGSGGDYDFTVTAANDVGNTFSQNYTLTVNALPTFTSVNSASYVAGTEGTFTVAASGYPTAVTYGLASGSNPLPAGVTLDSTTGVLSGIPTAGGGAYTVTLEASNGAGSTTQTFRANVGEAPVITSAASGSFNPGSAGSFTFTASGYPAPSFSVSSGKLPEGVSLNAATGLLSGTPAVGSGGVYPFTVTATNGISEASKAFTLTLGALPATALKIVAPTDVVSGSTNTVSVQAVDANGNVDKTATGTVTLVANGSGSLERAGGTGDLTADLTFGEATFTGLVYRAAADGESFTLKATAGSLSSPATQPILADVLATTLEIQGTPSTTTLESGVAASLSGLRLVGVDAFGVVDKQWLASGQTVKLSLTGPGDAPLDGVVSAFSLGGASAFSDRDSSATTITLDGKAIGSDGSIDLGALQLTTTNPSGSPTVALALKAERISASGPVLKGTLSASLTSSSAPITNRAPQLNLDPTNAPTTFTENGSAIAIVGPLASVSDVDNSLQLLQVAISNGQAGDLLALASTPSGLTAAYDASSGSLLIKAAANATPTLADFQDALLAVRYSNSSETPDTTPRLISVTANDGSGLANAIVTATRTLTVSAVDDPTTLTNLPASIAATEDTAAPLNLGALVLADPDGGDAVQTLTLYVRQGTTPSGSLSANNGPGVTVSGSNSAQLSLMGTISALNSYLQTSGVLTFTPASQANGNHVLSFDLVTGGTIQVLGSTTINVAAVNDPAVFSGVPPFSTVTRLRQGIVTSLQSLIGNQPISVADADLVEYGGTTQLTLDATNASLGGLSAGAHSGGATLTISTASTWVVTGTVAQINGLLADPAITLQSTIPGAVGLGLQINDGSNVAGSPLPGSSSSAAVAFQAVSDPVLNNPASSSARSISAGFGESLGFLSITDPDANSNPQTFTLTISDPAAGIALYGVTDGDGTTPGIQLTGTAAQINAQLQDARYKASTTGNSNLQLNLSNDLAPAISSTASFSAINSPPTLTQISTLSGAKEDQPLAISFSTLSAVANAADQGGSVEGFVVKAISSGTLKLGTTEQNATPWAAGSNDRITPTLNAYWTAAANANGMDSNALSAFTVVALDNSNGESITPVVVKVNVDPVNDAPTISGLPTVSTAVYTGVSSDLVDFSVADLDSSDLTLTLSPVNGTIGNLTDADSNRAGIQLTGTAAQINAAVANATFTAATVGSASINLTLEDGGAEVATASYSFSATKLNSAPTLSTPGTSRALTTGLADGLSYISVNDADTDQTLTLSLSASGGSFLGLTDADPNATG